jgi:transcriptional regulator with XRE-family HTH domain
MGSMMAKKISPVDAFAGGLARSRRQELGMSQSAVADAIGLTFQQVQKYEKGINRMGSSRLMQIASVLGVAPSYFFEGAPGRKDPTAKSPSPDYIAEFVASRDGTALIKAFAKISDAKIRRNIVTLVARLVE